MSINAQPFNPTFKLIGNLQEDQVLVYDVSENAFVNATGNGSGGASTSLDNIVNTGTGFQLAEITGSAIEMKSIIAGSNVTITDNGAALVFNASFEESIQSGTNLGVGNGIYANVNSATNQLQFKSIRVMGGLQLADDGQTITITYVGSGGSSDVDLSNYYTKAETLSEAESNAKFLRLDAHSLPTQNNMWDIGSASKRFNDIYAETLQGTAVLAENLTITGSEGDVLKYSGGRWVAGQVTSSGPTDTPNLSLNGNQLTIEGGNTITLPVYQDNDNFVRLDGDSLPTQNNVFDIGSAEFRFNDVYGETFQGTAVLADNLTITGAEGDVLTRIGSEWVARPASQAQIDLSDYATTDDLNTAISGITIPTDVSDLTDTTGLLGQGGNADLSDYYTKTEVDGLIPTIFSGDYNDLTNKPTIPTVPTDISQLTDTTGIIQAANTDSQTLTLTGTILQISGGNSVDLSAIDTNVDLTGYATQQWVIDQGFLTSDSDNQGLTLDGTVLSITNGNSVDLAAIDTNVDLTNYYTKTEVDGLIPTTFSGDYNDLTNAPTIPTTLESLSNVSNNQAVDGQHLVYDGANNQWKPSHASTGSETAYGDADARQAVSAATGLSYNSTTGVFALNAQISNLNDVDTTGIQNGQVLKWNGSSFVPGDDTVLTSTDQLPEGSTNLWYTDGRVEGVIASKTSDNFAEGSTNLYYTDARVDARLATQLIAGNNIALTSGANGVITISANIPASATYTDADARGAISVAGDLSYDVGTGVISYTAPTTTNWTAITNTPTTLAGYGITDAFDGAYSSLTGTPTIPTNVSDLTNDAGYLTSVGTISYNDLSDKPTLFDGAYASLTGTPTIPADVSDLTDTSGLLGGGFSGNYNDLTNLPTIPTDVSDLVDTTNLLDHFSGAYADLTGAPTIPSALTDLSIVDGTSGQVLTTDGAGNFSFTTVSGGTGSSYGDADVKSYLNGGWDFHLLPTTNATYDLGSAEKKVRHLYLSNNSIYMGDELNTLRTNGATLLFNGQDVLDWNNVKNKPTIPTDISDLSDTSSLLGSSSLTAGSGIQINSGVVSLNANLGDLQNVASAAPTTGQVLKWNGAQWAPGADSEGSGGTDLSTTSINALNDVDTTGIQNGQFLTWDGTKFVASAPSTVDLSLETLSELGDVATDSPVNGDSLVWNGSQWSPTAISGGSGGSGANVEYFKLNYATTGSLDSITNNTTGISATILSASGGDVEIIFSGYNFPPCGVLIYGYSYATNEYNMTPLNKDITTRKIAGGGSAGSPTAFGAMGSLTLTLKLREAETGASRSFGTPTHAWVMFTMI